MYFGMPTLIEVDSVEKTVELCAQLGLSFVELNTNFPMHQPHLLDAEKLVELAKKYGIFYTIHLNDEMAVAEFNPHVAKGYRDAVAETIALAKKIGAKTINMHLNDGAKYTMPDRIVRFYEAYEPEYLSQMAMFRDLCQEQIGDSGITICVENTDGFKSYQKKALEVLLQSPVFGLTMDIGHNACAKKVDEDLILHHRHRLHHMHAHDVKDEKSDHLALGEGELDLPKFLNLARDCNCTVVLETKTVAGLTKSAQWVKRNGFSQ